MEFGACDLEFKIMKICIIGAGYVGLVTAAGLAELGNNVICVDKDKTKISALKKNKAPFFEPGLKKLLKKNKNRLVFSSDAASAVKSSEAVIIAVGTPSLNNGEAAMDDFWRAAETIGKNLNGYKIIFLRSTVPFGTNEELKKRLTFRRGGVEFDTVANPEFLSQGTALKNFFHPNFLVIGSDSTRGRKNALRLYKGLKLKKDRIFLTDYKTAELVKYAANNFLALKISYANELAGLADALGADVGEVTRVIGKDPRIGPKFLQPGVGFGGSCLPKDLKAVLYIAKKNKVSLKVLAGVLAANEAQKEVVLKKIGKRFPSLRSRRIAVWGLSFKPETDDMRDAPSIGIIAALIKKGAKVSAYDPRAVIKAKAVLPGSVKFSPTAHGALKNADALIIVTEWDEFKNPDYGKMKKLMRRPLIIDGRNVLNPKGARAAGFEYEGIGRR